MLTNPRQVAIIFNSLEEDDLEKKLSQLRLFVRERGWMIKDEIINNNSLKAVRPSGFAALILELKKERVDIILVWQANWLGKSVKDIYGNSWFNNACFYDRSGIYCR